jgi:hypothetical protein
MESFSIWNWIIVLIILVPVLIVPIISIMIFGFQSKVLIKHSESGLTKKGYVGWSWTYYLFGCLVPIVRGEIGIGLLHFVLTCITFGIFQAIMSCLYNKQHISRMLTTGWVLADSEQKNDYAKQKLGIVS